MLKHGTAIERSENGNKNRFRRRERFVVLQDVIETGIKLTENYRPA